jgi:hypothetical protein
VPLWGKARQKLRDGGRDEAVDGASDVRSGDDATVGMLTSGRPVAVFSAAPLTFDAG